MKNTMILTWNHHRAGNFPTKLWTLTMPESIPEFGQNTSSGTKFQMIQLSKRLKKKYGWELEEKGYEAIDEAGTIVAAINVSDDLPPSNLVFGEKYKKTGYDNKLTSFNMNYKPDVDDWTWDEFQNSAGQEDIHNYSQTIKKMETLFPKEDWDGIWNRIKHVPADVVNARFAAQLKPNRKASGQLGREEDVTNYKADKEYHNEFHGVKSKDYSDLVSKLELFSK